MSSRRSIAPFLADGAIVINKSTVLVGSTHEVHGLIGRDDVAVVSDPELTDPATSELVKYVCNVYL